MLRYFCYLSYVSSQMFPLYRLNLDSLPALLVYFWKPYGKKPVFLGRFYLLGFNFGLTALEERCDGALNCSIPRVPFAGQFEGSDAELFPHLWLIYQRCNRHPQAFRVFRGA